MDMLLISEKIKETRNSRRQTLDDMSSLMGIDKAYISRIENGKVRPSKSFLEKFISVYSLSKLESDSIMSLAGYLTTYRDKLNSQTTRGEVSQVMEGDNKLPVNTQTATVNVPPDLKVLYSDSIFLTATKYGLTIDIAQTLGPTNSQTVVARIGISKMHALELSKLLNKKIAEIEKLEKGDELKKN